MPAAGGCGGGGSATASGSGAAAQRSAAMETSAAAAGVAQLTSPSQATPAQRFTAKNSTWAQAPGQASSDPRAQKAFAALQKAISQYPTEAALRAAGYAPATPGSNHFTKQGIREFYDDGETHLAHFIVKDGKVTSAQFDSNKRNATDQPPPWAGVQWHYHDHGKSGWMFHVDATKPIDSAFVEQHAH